MIQNGICDPELITHHHYLTSLVLLWLNGPTSSVSRLPSQKRRFYYCSKEDKVSIKAPLFRRNVGFTNVYKLLDI